MPTYPYKCSCGIEIDIMRPMRFSHIDAFCPQCGNKMHKTYGISNVIGTRDSFGIKKAFMTEEGKEITTWREWERAGYKSAADDPNLKPRMKDMIKEKKEKIRLNKKQRFSI